MAKSSDLSSNQNINIRSKYVLNGPLYHQLLPYHAPPVLPKAKKANNEASGYTSIYKNWPKKPTTTNIDDEIDGFYLPGPRKTPVADDEGDDFIIIRRSNLPLLQHLSVTGDGGRFSTDRSSRAHSRSSSRTAKGPNGDAKDAEAEHFEQVENRVKRFVGESEKQTADLLATTRTNTSNLLEERDERAKRIRQRLFLKKNSPFSATQSLVATRLEEKLYATSPIDLLIQKNRTRCQYSQLPEIRKQYEQKQQGADNSRQVQRILDRGHNSAGVREMSEVVLSKDLQRAIRGKSANAIGAALYAESLKNIKNSRNVHEANQNCVVKYQRCGSEECTDEELMMMMQQSRAASEHRSMRTTHIEMMDNRAIEHLDQNVTNSLQACRYQLKNFSHTSDDLYAASSKQTAIEIEQLNARLVEAETKLKTEVLRIKKKLQITITELEMSLDVANKTNIDLQKTIKKQSLQLTEIQAHYDDIQRQLQQTLDQYAVAQRRIASLTSEIEEVRANYENALRGKRAAEISCEEAGTRITELNNINVSLSTMRSKLEQELSTIASDYEEVTRELRLSDERYQKVQVELKSTIEILHEEQERVVKIETIKKSLEVEVKNLSIRLEEVEANAIVGSKRIISKLEARVRDLELELEEEKRRHAETIKILRKKERTVKEMMIQCEEDQKNVLILQETLEKANQKISIYKRQLTEQEGMSAQSVTRVRRFQRELEAAEDRADVAETNLNMIRAKHRSFVTTSTVPGGAVYVVESTRTITE